MRVRPRAGGRPGPQRPAAGFSFLLVDPAPEIRVAVRRAAERLRLAPLVDAPGSRASGPSAEDWARLWFEIEVDALVDADLGRRDPARASLARLLRRAGTRARSPARGRRVRGAPDDPRVLQPGSPSSVDVRQRPPHTLVFLECETCGAILGQVELSGISMIDAITFRRVRCSGCDPGSERGQAIAARLDRGR